jgi:hypothetical protein
VSGLERVEAEGVHVVPARRTVVLAVPLESEARERLAVLLDARIIDVRTECADADLVIYPAASPQLLGELKDKYPKARFVVTELEDWELDIDRTGPVTRLLRSGADAYVVAHSLDDLAYKLGATTSAPSGAARQEHSMPREILAAGPADDLAAVLGQIAEQHAPQPAERRPAGT